MGRYWGPARAGFICGRAACAPVLGPRGAGRRSARAAMGCRWAFLIGLLGAMWLLGSGHGGQQAPETAAQRCFCQVRAVRGRASAPVLPASPLRSVPGSPASEGLGGPLSFHPSGRVPSCGAESSAARLAWCGPVSQRSPPSDPVLGERCGCTLLCFYRVGLCIFVGLPFPGRAWTLCTHTHYLLI